jgi:holin-like protein
MLKNIFIIFLYQLVGESIQKYFLLNIPGPVIGLILLLITFIFLGKKSKDIVRLKKEISETANQIINYLSLLFVPIGVGVVMHISYLEKNLINVLIVIIIGTVLTIGFTAYLMEKINNWEKNDRKR